MLLLGLLYVSPCLLALINSFKTLPEIVRSPVALPTAPTLENYHYIFTGIKLVAPMFNSFLMCAAVIATLIVVSSMAAYSLTRRRMRTGSFWRIFFLAGITVPFQILMLPLVRQFNYLGIGYTYFALWLHYVSYGLPLCLFIYSSFMRSIPRDLEEAAQIDGCTPFGTFWRVIFPLLTPCTITIIIFWGLFTWNDFPHAFILMGTNKGELAFVQLWRFLSDNVRQELELHLRRRRGLVAAHHYTLSCHAAPLRQRTNRWFHSMSPMPLPNSHPSPLPPSSLSEPAPVRKTPASCASPAISVADPASKSTGTSGRPPSSAKTPAGPWS